jgi:hypothetical protein
MTTFPQIFDAGLKHARRAGKTRASAGSGNP